MRKRAVFYAVCAVLSLALAGVALADNHAIKLSEKDGVGKFFTDSKGMTLYMRGPLCREVASLFP
jgi:predicted lipoprotein with Yx(FWY)xxD motif